MDSKIRDKITDILKKCNKQRLIVVAGIIGILLILLSEMVPTASQPKKASEKFDYYSYTQSLEEKTQSIISSIEGVGRCEVMITVFETDENIFAKNIDESSDDGSISKKSEYVFYEADSGDSPVLVKQTLPEVQGVLIVCEGGDNVVVRETVISSVTSLFNIPSSKVSVSKISDNR